MLFKRIAGLLAMAIGIPGVIACIAGAYVVWLAASRLETANEKIFATIDRGLASTQDRVRGAQKRLKESRITTGEITQGLRDWSTRKVEERLVARLEIERRADILSGHLRTADTWLETSSESIRILQEILELSNSLGAQVEPASLDELSATVAALRDKLHQSEQMVDGVRDFADMDGASPENRLARALKLAARILVTIGDADTRLDGTIARLSELRTEAEELKARANKYILWTSIGCYLVLAWIAAGQIALCLTGWKGLFRGSEAGAH